MNRYTFSVKYVDRASRRNHELEIVVLAPEWGTALAKASEELGALPGAKEAHAADNLRLTRIEAGV